MAQNQAAIARGNAAVGRVDAQFGAVLFGPPLIALAATGVPAAVALVQAGSPVLGTGLGILAADGVAGGVRGTVTTNFRSPLAEGGNYITSTGNYGSNIGGLGAGDATVIVGNLGQLGARGVQAVFGSSGRATSSSGAAAVPERNVVDLLTSNSEAHAFARHGGAITDTQLMTRAWTGLAPDGYQANVIPRMSTAFHSDDLLRFADQTIRNGGALQAAVNAAPAGATRVVVSPSLAGDLGVSLGRGFERIGKVPGLQGPLRLVPDLRSANGVYVRNPASGNWETLTLYPAR